MDSTRSSAQPEKLRSVVNNPNPGEPYRAWEGKVGCFIEDGKAFVTSPNSSVVYLPLHGDRNVYLRGDDRLGEDDPLLYPQPFIPTRCHYAVLQRRPSDPRDALFKWFQPLPTNAFVQDGHSVVDGLGTWDGQYLVSYRMDLDVLQQRVQDYRDRQQKLGARINGMVSAASLQLQQTLPHLTSIAMSLFRAQELFAWFQRWFLELQAALDWVELCVPAMENRDYDRHALAAVTRNAIGAFLYRLKDCESFFCAGVPFWYVRPTLQLPSTRVDSEVVPISPAHLGLHLAERLNQPRRVIFTGKGDDIEKARAIETYGYRIVDFPDAFQDFRAPASDKTSLAKDTSSPGPSRTKQNRKKRQATSAPYPRSGVEKLTQPERDKFTELRGDYSPLVADVWVNAVATIDRGRSSNPKPSLYVLPDPGMMLWQAYRSDDIMDKDKFIRYLKTWLDFRSVLVFRLQVLPSSAATIAWSGKTWRILFGTLDANHEAKAGTVMERQRNVINDLLGQCLKSNGLTLLDVRGQRGQYHVGWRGQEYGVGRLREPALAREVLYELFELNFRLELVALDRRLRPDTVPQRDGVSELHFKNERIMACFPGVNLSDCITTISWQKAAAGLSAEELKARGKWFLRLRDVVKEWPGAERILALPDRQRVKDCSEEELKEIEKTVAEFYCQTFYDTFGRPPIIPHRLSHHVPILPGDMISSA